MDIYTSVVDKYTKRYRLKSLVERGLKRYLFKRLMRSGFISDKDFISGIGWWKLMYKKRNLFRFLFYFTTTDFTTTDFTTTDFITTDFITTEKWYHYIVEVVPPSKKQD